MGGKVKGRRFLIVLSREEERIVKAAADASGEPRATFIRHAAVAQALESALAIDDQLHCSGKADEPGDEESGVSGGEGWLHTVGRTLLQRPEWIRYLRMYTWPQVPSGMEGLGPDKPVPPWTQPAVARREWAPSRVLTLSFPEDPKVRRNALRRQAR